MVLVDELLTITLLLAVSIVEVLAPSCPLFIRMSADAAVSVWHMSADAAVKAWQLAVGGLSGRTR